MKKLSVLFAFCLATSVYACPDLAGKYTCKGKGGSSQVMVSQTMEKGVTVYTVVKDNGKAESYTADGESRPVKVQVNDQTLDATITTTCQEDASVTSTVLTKYMDSDINYSVECAVNDGGFTHTTTILVNGQNYSNEVQECLRD
jgi:hypothetical protein